MRLRGESIKLKDNINTDLIISGRYKFSITNMKELSGHIFEDMDPDFPRKIVPGKSIIVAGRNFGLGSSREQAPLVIKEAGIIAILAKSFARIFYRNAFNIGLPLIEVDTDKIKEKDSLEVDFKNGLLRNLTQNAEIPIGPLPDFMYHFIKEGGVVKYYKKYARLPEI